VQAGSSDAADQLTVSATQLASRIEPVAASLGETLVDNANKLEQGATEQGQQLAEKIEDAGQTLGE
jgi:hypothetical protein